MTALRVLGAQEFREYGGSPAFLQFPSRPVLDRQDRRFIRLPTWRRLGAPPQCGRVEDGDVAAGDLDIAMRREP